MKLRVAKVTALFVLGTAMAVATAPPPGASFEEEVCSATHVFVGKSRNLRIVADDLNPKCAGKPAEAGGFLTMCGAAEVDIEVEEVLFPTAWKPTGTVRYRFGGGLFSLESLQRDLKDQRYVFHTVIISTTDAPIFGPSYPWVLAKSLAEASKVKETLAGCKRAK